MIVNVKLIGRVRDYRSGYKPGEVLHVELPPGATLADLYAQFDVPPGAAVLAMVQNRVQKRDFVLTEGDEVNLFPPVSGG